MSLNPLTLLEKAINEHGSAVILKERLALARDEFVVLERKNSELVSQSFVLTQQIGVLESENHALHLQVQNLQQQITTQKPVIQTKPADTCPFCNHHAGILERREPHPVFGTALFVHSYKCRNCGKDYERESKT